MLDERAARREPLGGECANADRAMHIQRRPPMRHVTARAHHALVSPLPGTFACQ
jgi:hypothetical protein